MFIENKEKQLEYYNALVNKDESYIGTFFAAVKTTSIFCISTCRARKPKFENTDFYSDFKDALDYGYRPCKICKPTERANETPEMVEKAIQLVKDNPKEKIKDYFLREEGISPEVLRRWFKKNYGMTFHAFQRMYRINNAFNELKSGKKTPEIAYESGYESLSGFSYTFKKIMGKSPQLIENPPILIHRITTPIGPMFICATDQGVCLLEFVDRRMLESEFLDIQKRLKTNIIIGENQHIKEMKSQLDEYFDGNRKHFDVPLHPQGTSFQLEVWKLLREIPIGTTSSYKQQAIKLDNPKAIRAVASANGYNKIAIVIPCHRVIGSDGSLTGYGGGLERKAWLLKHEAMMV